MNSDNIIIKFDKILLDISKKDFKRLKKSIKHQNKYYLINLNIYTKNKCINDIEWSLYAKRMFLNGNAGGSSLLSEMLSYEIFNKIGNAVLFRSEKELDYVFPDGPLADYTMYITDNKLYCTSVSRAFCYYNNFNKEKCYNLLYKKFSKIKYIEKNINNGNIYKNILHIFTTTNNNLDIIKSVYLELPLYIKKNIIFIVTITNIVDIFRDN